MVQHADIYILLMLLVLTSVLFCLQRMSQKTKAIIATVLATLAVSVVLMTSYWKQFEIKLILEPLDSQLHWKPEMMFKVGFTWEPANFFNNGDFEKAAEINWECISLKRHLLHSNVFTKDIFLFIKRYQDKAIKFWQVQGKPNPGDVAILEWQLANILVINNKCQIVF